MQHTIPTHARTTPTLLVGLLLVAAGAAVLVLREAGVDLTTLVGEAGWPFLVIVPGLVLLAAAAIPAPPRGIGFAIAGAIVTTAGLVLLYQARSGDWESWAYLWAAIPLAIGLAFLAYGALTGDGRMVTAGLWVGGVATLVLGVGAWFFQGVFHGESSVWSSTWWAIIAIVAGVVISIRGITGRGGSSQPR